MAETRNALYSTLGFSLAFWGSRITTLTIALAAPNSFTHCAVSAFQHLIIAILFQQLRFQRTKSCSPMQSFFSVLSFTQPRWQRIRTPHNYQHRAAISFFFVLAGVSPSLCDGSVMYMLFILELRCHFNVFLFISFFLASFSQNSLPS